MESLDNILSGQRTSAPAPEATPTPAPEKPQDAPQPASATPAPSPNGQQPEPEVIEGETTGPDGQKLVPVAALQAERGKAKRYTEQIASFEQTLKDRETAWERRFSQILEQLKPPQQAPEPADFFDNPHAFVQQETEPVRQAIEAQRQQFSQLLAVEKFGAEAVDAACAELKRRVDQNPQAAHADYLRIMRSPHPYGELVQWHKQQQAFAEIGSDPEAYKAKLKAELLAEIHQNGNGAGATTPNGQTPAPVMPSNFAAARNVGNRSGPAWSGPKPLNDIFKR